MRREKSSPEEAQDARPSPSCEEAHGEGQQRAPSWLSSLWRELGGDLTWVERVDSVPDTVPGALL